MSLIRFHNRHLLLPMRYFGSIGYYALAAAFGSSGFDHSARFDKRQKSVHRTAVADTHGVVELTVPLVRPHSEGGVRPLWRDVRISDHGDWWHVHRVTLESAYGRTPFFEFYIDRFLPMLTTGVVDRFSTVAALDGEIDRQIRSILLLPPAVEEASPESVRFDDALARNAQVIAEMDEYWQVRKERFGFLPDLSILDLIFNLGPESPLYLKSLVDRFLQP